MPQHNPPKPQGITKEEYQLKQMALEDQTFKANVVQQLNSLEENVQSLVDVVSVLKASVKSDKREMVDAYIQLKDIVMHFNGAIKNSVQVNSDAISVIKGQVNGIYNTTARSYDLDQEVKKLRDQVAQVEMKSQIEVAKLLDLIRHSEQALSNRIDARFCCRPPPTEKIALIEDFVKCNIEALNNVKSLNDSRYEGMQNSLNLLKLRVEHLKSMIVDLKET